MPEKTAFSGDSNSLVRISNYIDTFNFPRLSGTVGEKKAVDLTIEKFKEIGFESGQIKTETFEFSNFYSIVLIKLIIILSFSIILSLMLMIYISHILLFVVIGVSVLMILLIIKDNRRPEKPTFWNKHFGKTLTSSNVYIRIPSSQASRQSVGNILLSAHLDSKSQPFTSFWRGKIYRVWLYGGILFGIIYSIYALYIYYSYSIVGVLVYSNAPRLLLIELTLWIIFFLILTSNILLLSIRSRNKSTGALDNASGMAIVFELSSFFKDNPLNNFNLWFCQFGAEESGTMGSRFFLKSHEDKDQFLKGKVFLINSDAVSDGRNRNDERLEYIKSTKFLPRREASPLLSKHLEQAARDENIEIRGFHSTFGIHFDSLPFRLRGFDAINIHSGACKKFTHSERDTPERINPRILHEAVRIIRKAVLLLDNDNRIK